MLFLLYFLHGLLTLFYRTPLFVVSINTVILKCLGLAVGSLIPGP